MKFDPGFPKWKGRQVNNRRLSAAKRAIQKERDKYPLFPELVEFETPEERIAAMDAKAAIWVAGLRGFEARQWRKATTAGWVCFETTD